MKKVLTLIIALVMLISITSVSFAVVKYGQNDDKIEPLLGIWFNNDKTVLFVGLNEDLGFYTFRFVMFDNKKVSEYEYSITYDDELGIFYLSNSAETVTYKVSFEDGKIIRRSIFIGNEDVFEKISN